MNIWKSALHWKVQESLDLRNVPSSTEIPSIPLRCSNTFCTTRKIQWAHLSTTEKWLSQLLNYEMLKRLSILQMIKKLLLVLVNLLTNSLAPQAISWHHFSRISRQLLSPGNQASITAWIILYIKTWLPTSKESGNITHFLLLLRNIDSIIYVSLLQRLLNGPVPYLPPPALIK